MKGLEQVSLYGLATVLVYEDEWIYTTPSTSLSKKDRKIATKSGNCEIVKHFHSTDKAESFVRDYLENWKGSKENNIYRTHGTNLTYFCSSCGKQAPKEFVFYVKTRNL
jgi:NAD-dependent SIR2 family protein deacetylase